MKKVDELGHAREPLCREPWESYYILRRGILPCCYGASPIAPMSDWESAWNSPAIQDIRRHLLRGTLSPYCLASLGCPVVQRYLDERRRSPLWVMRAAARRANRLLGGVPSRALRAAAVLVRSRTR